MAEKLFLLVPSLTIGGQEKAVVDTAKLMQDRYDVTIILFHRHEAEYEAPCNVVCLDVGANTSAIKRIFAQIRRTLKFISICRKEKPHIVYSFGESANLTNILSGFFTKGKRIVAIHGFASVYKSLINRTVFKHSDAIICISQAMQSKLLELYPKIKHSVVIENGYDIERIRELSLAPAEVSNGSPKFVAMGRLEEVKAFHRALNAFAEITKVLPEATLTLVGSGTQEAKLKSLCESLCLNDRVVFAGFQKNPYAFLSKSDIFLLCSYSEGFPNALVEAMACGTACVCVDCQTGPREILAKTYTPAPIQGVVNEEYGILVQQDSNDAVVEKFLAEAMLRMGSNADTLHTYKTRSRQRATAFTGEIYKNKLLSLFEREL